MENETFLEEFKRYIANPKSRLILITSVAIISVVSIVLVFVVINNHNTSQEIEEAKKIEENPAQKADLLAKIIKNNPKTSVNPSLSPTGSTSGDQVDKDKFTGNSGYAAVDPTTGLLIGIGGANNLMAVGPSEQPDLTRYNFRKTTETVSPGNITNICNYPYSYIAKSRYSTAEFFDSSNSYYARTTQYDDGSLKGFVNSHYGKTINETYTYAGGDYAIKQKYKPYWYEGDSNLITSYPIPNYPQVSTPVSYPELNGIIQNYFGGNAVIQRVYQEANRTFYEIRVSNLYNCIDNTNPAVTPYLDENGKVNFVSIYTVDSANFEISNTKTYLNSISTENLVFVRDYKVEYQLTKFDTVSSEFNNVAAPEVRTLDWSNYTFDKHEFATRLAKYLKENSIDIVLPRDDVDLSYAYGKNIPSVKENGDYFKDRKFYTPGEKGDATYADLMKRFGPSTPLLYYSTQTKNQYYTFAFSQYESGVDKAALLKNFNEYSPFGTTQFSRNINISGESVEVKLKQSIYSNYYNSTSYPVSYVEALSEKFPTISPLSYPLSFPQQAYFYINYQFYFEYHDKVYTGYISAWAIDRFLNDTMDNVKAGEDDGFYELSLAIYNGVYGGDYGYGYSFGYPY